MASNADSTTPVKSRSSSVASTARDSNATPKKSHDDVLSSSPTVASKAPVSRSPKRDPVAVQKHVDYSSLKTMAADYLDTFVKKFPARKIRRDEIPVISAEASRGSVGDEHFDATVVVTEARIFPIVTIEDMPPAAYPEHIGYLTRATVAAAASNSAGLADMVKDRFVQQLAAMVVAVRCGVWAAIGHVPTRAEHSASACAVYQADKARAIRKPLAEVRHMELWYVYFEQAQQVSTTMLQLAHWLAHLAPVFLGMQCMAMAASGESFSVPYIQQAVMRHLKGKLTKDAVAIANLSKPVVWAALMGAAAYGLPKPAVDAWASDPLFQIQAQRRMLSTAAEIASSKRQEAAVRENTRRSGIDFEAASVVGIDTGFAAAAQAAMTRAREDDVGSVVDDYEWDSEAERNMTYGHSPTPNEDVWDTSASPVHDMTPDEADAIRLAVRDAASTGPRAASEMLGADDDQQVVW